MKSTPSSEKKRVIVDYKNVTSEILDLFTDRYPYGYGDEDVIKFKNSKGDNVSAVPMETKDTKYLIKVGVEMDRKIEAFLEEDDEENTTAAGEASVDVESIEGSIDED